jgi:hypothetical protein
MIKLKKLKLKIKKKTYLVWWILLIVCSFKDYLQKAKDKGKEYHLGKHK